MFRRFQRTFYLLVCLVTGVGLLQAQVEPAAEVLQKEAPPSAPAGILQRANLTGEWFGARPKLARAGFSFDVSLTQFGQGAAAGGSEQGFDYTAKAIYAMHVDAKQLGAWNGLSADIKGETRFGSGGLFSVGTLLPINTAVILPKDSGAVSAITALTLTQVVKNKYVVQIGKFNTLDLVANPFAGGSGIKTFMNLGITAPPVDAKTVPPVTNGALLAYLRGYEPLFSLAVLDSEDSSTTSGLARPFDKGVTLVPTLSIPVRFEKGSGHQIVYGTWSNLSATSLDKIGQLIIPPGDEPVAKVEGSWSMSYSFDQYLRQDSKAPSKGWGIFGQLGVTDKNPAPVSVYTTVGLGGNGIFAGRSQDRFGVAYFYADLSNSLKQATQPLLKLRAEQGGELFYNWAALPWFRVSADLQIVQAFRSGVDLAVVPAIRGQITF